MTGEPAAAGSGTDAGSDVVAEPSARRKRLALLLRILGIAVAVVAVYFLVRAVQRDWPTVSAALATANYWWVAAALVVSGLGMFGLAVLWRQTLVVFDRPWPLRRVTAWYFGGELGKYLPGGIWPVIGRGELARRGGVSRTTAYATTLLSLALMCVGAAFACGLLAPFMALDGGRLGPELLLLVLIPAGIVFALPAVSGRVFALLSKVTKGRVQLAAPRFGRMFGLILTGLPTWLCVGGASALIALALGYDQNPARVAFAAILAWIVGFLIVPVPAGAGVRELLFVAVCGLDGGPAVVVATIARLLLIVVDGVGGVTGLAASRRATGRVAAARQQV